MDLFYNCNAYACFTKNEDDLMKSASGGVFGILASYVLKNGGVVFGAAYDEKLSVNHIMIDDIHDLDKLRKPKFVQSRIGDSFIQIRKFLEAGRLCLFSGTPCQVGGLNNFLDKEYTNLYTVDLICHGVPSPMVLRNYIKDKERKGLKSIDFRYKKYGWKWYKVMYEYKCHEEVINLSEDLYFRGFNFNHYLRESCYCCNFTYLNSGADMTIGDYWNINEEHPEMWNDNKGVSAVVVKTHKGEELFDLCKDKMVWKSTTVKQIVRFNVRMLTPVPMTKIREVFFDAYHKNNKSLELTYKNLPHIKIGIIGSYNSRLAIHRLKRCDGIVDMPFHISNSSVVSMMSKKIAIEGVDNREIDNKYRKDAVDGDFRKLFSKGLTENYSKADYVLVDFLEERYNLLYNGQSYITKSEAFDSVVGEIEGFEEVNRLDLSMEIWKDNCRKFIKQLEQDFSHDKIILNKLFLCEKYGKKFGEKTFDNIKEIKEINSLLEEYYRFFQDNCKGICVIENKDINLAYTMENFEYGCLPVYYNNRMYEEIKNELVYIFGDRKVKKELNKCCGCEACAQICPVKAIEMAEGYDGFMYPKIDKNKCIDCNLCEKKCPVGIIKEEING